MRIFVLILTVILWFIFGCDVLRVMAGDTDSIFDSRIMLIVFTVVGFFTASASTHWLLGGKLLWFKK